MNPPHQNEGEIFFSKNFYVYSTWILNHLSLTHTYWQWHRQNFIFVRQTIKWVNCVCNYLSSDMNVRSTPKMITQRISTSFSLFLTHVSCHLSFTQQSTCRLSSSYVLSIAWVRLLRFAAEKRKEFHKYFLYAHSAQTPSQVEARNDHTLSSCSFIWPLSMANSISVLFHCPNALCKSTILLAQQWLTRQHVFLSLFFTQSNAIGNGKLIISSVKKNFFFLRTGTDVEWNVENVVKESMRLVEYEKTVTGQWPAAMTEINVHVKRV